MDEYEAGSLSSYNRRNHSRMDSVDISSSDSDDDMEGAAAPKERKMDREFYKQFEFGYRSEVQLPIHENEESILSTIEKNPVCILTGDTGCGKTTQVSSCIFSEKSTFCKAFFCYVKTCMIVLTMLVVTMFRITVSGIFAIRISG